MRNNHHGGHSDVDHVAIRELLSCYGYVPRPGIEVTDLHDGVGVHHTNTDQIVVVCDPDGFARAMMEGTCKRHLDSRTR